MITQEQFTKEMLLRLSEFGADEAIRLLLEKLYFTQQQVCEAEEIFSKLNGRWVEVTNLCPDCICHYVIPDLREYNPEYPFCKSCSDKRLRYKSC